MQNYQIQKEKEGGEGEGIRWQIGHMTEYTLDEMRKGETTKHYENKKKRRYITVDCGG